MLDLDFHPAGRHFPCRSQGLRHVPDRILRAMSLPTIDHRGPEFGLLGRQVLTAVREVFKTRHPVVIYPEKLRHRGVGGCAIQHSQPRRDHVLIYETGHFASLWAKMATRLGLSAEVLAWTGKDDLLPHAPSWRRGVQADLIEQRLRRDPERKIKAVCVVHNETSTGALSDIPAVRAALDASQHSALLMVDTISSLACADYRHDEWGVDVTISGSQKGLMLPPGIGFNAISPKALEASRTAKAAARVFRVGRDRGNEQGRLLAVHTQHKPALRPGGRPSDMLASEGLENVFARHQRWGAAARAAVNHLGTSHPMCRPLGLLSRAHRSHHSRRYGRGCAAAVDL